MTRPKQGIIATVTDILHKGVIKWIVGLVAGALALVVLSIIALPPVRAALTTSVCDPAFMHTACASVGILADNDRDRLLDSVAGTWGRQDRSCAEGTVTYRVLRGDEGDDRLSRGSDWTGQVWAAEDNAIVVRSTSDTGGAREQWEFRLEGDRMHVIDKDGVTTTLVRCAR